MPISRVGTFETHADHAYYPAQAAVEMGITLPSLDDLRDFDRTANPPGVEILSGRIPNNKQAGFVPNGEGRTMAFDHAAVSFEGSRLQVMPTPKAAVTSEGGIEQEGAIVLGMDVDLIKLPFIALSASKNFWTLERMQSEGRRIGYCGDLAIFSTLGLPEYEITDIDSRNGLITALPRKQLY